MSVTSFELMASYGGLPKSMFVKVAFFLLAVMLCVFSGCKKWKSPSPFLSRLDDYAFEQTPFEVADWERDKGELVSARFNATAWGDAMRVLSDLSGKNIVWDSGCDSTAVSGSFYEQSVESILSSLSRRGGFDVSPFQGGYFVGTASSGDRVTAVVPMLPVSKDDIVKLAGVLSSDIGKAVVVGSSIIIVDKIETVRRIVSDFDDLRNRSNRVYLAEVYFLRMSEDDFIDLTARLKVNAVDVFASQFNVEQLFSMFLDAAATSSRVKVDQRPVLYLSEGRPSKMNVGSEVVRERRVVRENGVTEVSGYERFSDGLMLSLTCSRVAAAKYMLDFDLTVSTFGKTTGNALPPLDKSDLRSEGMLVDDGKVFYVGSLRREHHSKTGGLFSFAGSKLNETMTIWVRVRELKSERPALVGISNVGTVAHAAFVGQSIGGGVL